MPRTVVSKRSAATPSATTTNTGTTIPTPAKNASASTTNSSSTSEKERETNEQEKHLSTEVTPQTTPPAQPSTETSKSGPSQVSSSQTDNSQDDPSQADPSQPATTTTPLSTSTLTMLCELRHKKKFRRISLEIINEPIPTTNEHRVAILKSLFRGCTTVDEAVALLEAEKFKNDVNNFVLDNFNVKFDSKLEALSYLHKNMKSKAKTKSATKKSTSLAGPSTPPSRTAGKKRKSSVSPKTNNGKARMLSTKVQRATKKLQEVDSGNETTIRPKLNGTNMVPSFDDLAKFFLYVEKLDDYAATFYDDESNSKQGERRKYVNLKCKLKARVLQLQERNSAYSTSAPTFNMLLGSIHSNFATIKLSVWKLSLPYLLEGGIVELNNPSVGLFDKRGRRALGNQSRSDFYTRCWQLNVAKEGQIKVVIPTPWHTGAPEIPEHLPAPNTCSALFGTTSIKAIVTPNHKAIKYDNILIPVTHVFRMHLNGESEHSAYLIYKTTDILDGDESSLKALQNSCETQVPIALHGLSYDDEGPCFVVQYYDDRLTEHRIECTTFSTVPSNPQLRQLQLRKHQVPQLPIPKDKAKVPLLDECQEAEQDFDDEEAIDSDSEWELQSNESELESSSDEESLLNSLSKQDLLTLIRKIKSRKR